MGKNSSIIEDYDHNDILVLGDFNANVNSPFFNEWGSLRETSDMVFVDVARIEVDSYTHVNNGTLSKSWLDHCLATSSVNGCIDHIEILYQYFASDHFPLTLILKFNLLPAQLETDDPIRRIKWDFDKMYKKQMLYRSVASRLPSVPSQFICSDTSCQSATHAAELEIM